MKKINHNLLILLLFVIGSGVFIQLNFRYFYAFMEQYMMFQTTSAYFVQHLSEPGGFSEYVTEFLSMLFYYPLGAASVIALFVGLISFSFYSFMKSCKVDKGMFAAVLPAFLLLVFPQEAITHYVTLAVAVSFAALYASVGNEKLRWCLGIVMLVASYFLAAPANLILAMMVAVYELAVHRRYLPAVVAVVLGGLLPLLAMRTLFVLPMREIFLSRHIANLEVAVPKELWVIGLVYPLWAVALCAADKWMKLPDNKFVIWAQYGVVAFGLAACVIFKVDLMEQPYMYDYFARHDQWEKISDHARKNGVSDFDALVYANLAALHTGRMATDFTRTPQMGVYGLFPREAKYYIQNILAGEVAWQVGHVNMAQRASFIGTLGSRRSIQPRLMKRLVETYIITEEMAVAEKFIKILESYPPLSKWATAQRPLLDPEVAAKTDWVVKKRSLMPVTDNRHDMQTNFPAAVKGIVQDHPENRPALEYLLSYVLGYKDITNFMAYIEPYKGQPMPKLYQEVICVYFASMGSQKDLDEYKIDPSIWKRFMDYSRNMTMMGQETAYKLYGDTYYYYLQYGNMPAPPETQNQ